MTNHMTMLRKHPVSYSSKKRYPQRVTIRVKERASAATLKAKFDEATTKKNRPTNMAGAEL